jgi:hypothetical protein
MNYTNNFSARASYDIARQILYNSWIKSFNYDGGACWAWVNGRKLSQSEIRLEVELNTNNSVFNFAVTENQNNSTNVLFLTERRLPLQDSLIASEYGVFVAQPASRTDTGFRLNTYGNTQTFAAATAAALDSTFYSNGSLQVRVNNDTIIPYRGLMANWYIGQTQQTAAIGPASPKDQLRGAEDAYVTWEPNILFIGSKNYVPQIVLPGAMAAASEFLRTILICRGVYAQNSTVIN